MTVCDAAEHDEIVFDEQRYRHISGEKCPICRMIVEKDKEIAHLKDRLERAESDT